MESSNWSRIRVDGFAMGGKASMEGRKPNPTPATVPKSRGNPDQPPPSGITFIVAVGFQGSAWG